MLYVVLILIILFMAVVAVRTISFRPEKKKEISKEENDKSYIEPKTGDSYDEFLRMFPGCFPCIYRDCTIYRIPGKSSIVKWFGKSGEASSLISVSYKNRELFNSVMTAAESLIADGFVPENDVYIFIIGADEFNAEAKEEVRQWLSEKKISPSFALCEGGKLVSEIYKGDGNSCAFIGTADMTDTSSRGYYPVPVLDMFNTAGRKLKILNRIVLSNLWCFGGLLKGTLSGAGEEYREYVSCIGYKTETVSKSRGKYWSILRNVSLSQLPIDICSPAPEKNNETAKFLTKICKNVYRFSPDCEFEKCANFYENIFKRL